jgi:threonine dehydrogenase-like Zn-dependent dehydrogenase
LNNRAVDPMAEIMRLTNGRSADVAIDAMGTHGTRLAPL